MSLFVHLMHIWFDFEQDVMMQLTSNATV